MHLQQLFPKHWYKLFVKYNNLKSVSTLILIVLEFKKCCGQTDDTMYGLMNDLNAAKSGKQPVLTLAI